MPPASILEKCRSILSNEITEVRYLTGSIEVAYLLQTGIGSFFLKVNSLQFTGERYGAEASGLALLASARAIGTPAVLGHGSTAEGSFLLLEYIETGYRPDGFWESFGAAMAGLHRHTAPTFGLGQDNFIGSLPQPNCQHDNWPDFYINERLLPQLEKTKHGSLLQLADYQKFNQLFKYLGELCPNEPPALVHGDFWSGNFLCNTTGEPVIFDPAASYAHREMDLAMSRLFGGFERPFYRGYEEAWPLAPGFEQRLPVYQLYYLLAHTNLFGEGYVGAVRAALGKLL